MSILIDKSTRLIVQGITGRDGLFHASIFTSLIISDYSF